MSQKFTKKKNLLTVAMLLVFCAFTNNTIAQTSWNISDNSSSGNNVTATLTLADSTLTISGTGNMADFLYSSTGIPYNSYLTRIKTVVINSGVTNIGDIAFQGCSNLQWVTIPEGVTIIGERAFENCTSLSAIAIPASVATIEDRAFRNCNALKAIYNMATMPQNINNRNIFDGIYSFSDKYLAVPAQSISTYQSASVWGSFNVNPPYILIEQNINNAFDAAIVGLDGTWYFYEYWDNNTTIPKRLTVYNVNENAVKFVAYFDNNGKARKIVSEDGLSVLADNYSGNQCDLTITTKDGQSQTNIGVEVNSNTGSTVSFWEKANVFVGGLGCALSGIDFLLDPIAFDSYSKATATFGCLGTLNDAVTSTGLNGFFPNTSSETLFIISVLTTAVNCGMAAYTGGLLGGVQCVVGVAGIITSILADVFDGTSSNNCSNFGYSLTTGGMLTISSNDAFSCTPYPWADRKDEITKLIIGSGITSIPASAFQGYTNLQEVYIANSSDILTFDYYALNHFYGSSIGSLYLGRNISCSYGSPFNDNTLLTSLTIGNQVTSIPADCFSGCSNLATVEFGSGLETIGDYAFYGCEKMESPLTIPRGVTAIGEYAFYDCQKSESLFVPNAVNWIGIQAFSGCSNLKNVEFEDGSETLTFDYYGFNHFYGSSIGSLYLGRNISCSYGSPFNDNTSLTSLTIGNQVTSIPADCFYGCSNLATVEFGSGLETIGDYAFYGCEKMESPLTIPRGVTAIGEYAFYDCQKSESLFVPNAVNWIGIQAFSGCSNLKNVEFEDGSETLTFDYYGFNHFYGSSIGSLYLGRNISCSYGSPFNDNTLLTSLTIGNQVTSIPANCFSGCTGLTDVTVKWATPLSINNDVFQNVAVSNVRLYIPRGTGTTALYQAAPVWKDFIIIGDVEAAAETQITTATISWYEVPSATSYDLAVYTDAACTQVFGTYGINASGQAQAPMRSAQRASDNRLSYTVTGLSPETPYWYTITAFENTDIIAVFTEDFVTQRTSDLTDILTNQLSIFPNPAKNDLFINSELQIKKVEIYSLTGNLLIQENNFIGKISVSGLSQGVYLFKVYTDKGVVVGKIMKE